MPYVSKLGYKKLRWPHNPLSSDKDRAKPGVLGWCDPVEKTRHNLEDWGDWSDLRISSPKSHGKHCKRCGKRWGWVMVHKSGTFLSPME